MINICGIITLSTHDDTPGIHITGVNGGEVVFTTAPHIIIAGKELDIDKLPWKVTQSNNCNTTNNDTVTGDNDTVLSDTSTGKKIGGILVRFKIKNAYDTV